MEKRKRCRKCGQEKPLNEFHKDRTKKDGHKSICKACLSKKKEKVSNIDKNIKQCLRYTIKYNGPFRWSEVLGYTKSELLEHLKSELLEDMTFENYGIVWGVTFHIPRRCYRFKNYWDNEFKKCWTLKNLKPDYIINCKKQKEKISKKEVEKYSLWDILPEGDIKSYLID